MVNRTIKPTDLPDLRLPQPSIDRLESIPRPSGEAASVFSEVASRISTRLGEIADRQAAVEGDAAGRVAGLDPNYRPSPQSTIRGMSFEKAATDTYVDRLETDLRAKMTAVYDTWDPSKGDLPSALIGGLDKVRQDLLPGVDPTVLGRFDTIYGRLRTAYSSQAAERFQNKVKDDSKAALADSLAAGGTTAARVAAGDPRSPATLDAVAGEIADQHAAIDRAVKAGDIPATSGQVLKTKATEGVMESLYRSQILSIPTADLPAEREKFRKDFAAGKLPNVSGDLYAKIDQEFLTEARARQTAVNKDRELLQQNITKVLQNAEAGILPSEGAEAVLRAQAAQHPETIALGDQMVRRIAIARSAQVGGMPALQKVEQDLVTKAGPNPPQAIGEDIRWLRNFMRSYQERQDKDPVGHFTDWGIIKAPPIDVGKASQQDLETSIADRVAAVDAGAAVSNVPRVYLRPEERAQAKDRFDKGGDGALAAVTGLLRGAGARTPQILAEIGKEAPELAHVANVISATGDVSFGRQVMGTLEAKNVKGASLPEISDDKMLAAYRKEVGQALSGPQQAERQRTMAAAKLWAQGEILKRNADPKVDSELNPILVEALQRARGAVGAGDATRGGIADVVQTHSGWLWNGSNKVQVPPNIRRDKFADVLGAITDADLASLADPPVDSTGKPLTADTLRSRIPVAGPGGYRWVTLDPAGATETVIPGRSGKPFVLSLDALYQQLRSRVPEAYK